MPWIEVRVWPWLDEPRFRLSYLSFFYKGKAYFTGTVSISCSCLEVNGYKIHASLFAVDSTTISLAMNLWIFIKKEKCSLDIDEFY